MAIPRATDFNSIETLDLKEVGKKDILWMVSAFSRMLVGVLLKDKKAEMIMEKLEMERLAALASRTKSSKSKSKEQVKLTGKQLFEVDTKMISSDAQLLAEIAFEQEQIERDEIFGSNVLTNKQKHDNQNDNNNGGVKSSDGGDQDLKNVDFSLFQAETEIDIS